MYKRNVLCYNGIRYRYALTTVVPVFPCEHRFPACSGENEGKCAFSAGACGRTGVDQRITAVIRGGNPLRYSAGQDCFLWIKKKSSIQRAEKPVNTGVRNPVTGMKTAVGRNPAPVVTEIAGTARAAAREMSLSAAKT